VAPLGRQFWGRLIVRLLYLSLNVPFPADNGHKMRTWGTLRALKAEGHEVTLLCLACDGTEDVDSAALKEGCDALEIIPHAATPASVSTDYTGRLRALASSRPYSAVRLASPALRTRVADLLAAGPVDAVVCDTIFMTANVPAEFPPIIVNSPDVEHVMLARFLAHERHPARRAYAAFELAKLRRWERAVCRRAALVLVCSAVDRAAIEALCPGARVAVVPNVIDVEQYSPAPEDDPSILLYSGGMDWYPNQDAVTYFAARIFPELRRRFPSLRFIVAGRTAPTNFHRRFRDLAGVEFTGPVPDMRAAIARAGLCVVPLRIASGTRLKILEAAAMAKPIVSTQVGAEGLDFIHGKEIILADEPAAFVEAVTELLSDPDRRTALGHAARRRVETAYGMPVLQQSVLAALTGEAWT
jgi:glycosyltransferase involved in cell wall biosynthesis